VTGQQDASHTLPETAHVPQTPKWEAEDKAMKFTTGAIAALVLPEGKVDHLEWDDALPGFGVRLRGNSKRWVVQYRITGGQQRRESLGDVRKVTLDHARKIAQQRFAKVELGVDPAAERAHARERAAAQGLTLAVVAGRYLDAKCDRLRPRTYQQAELHFMQHWAPLRSRPIGAITRADVAARLQELMKTRGRTSAARARGNLSAMYGWAMREGLCETNPVIATNDPNAGVLARDRVLDDTEIRIIWRACDDDSDASRIVKLLLLTGCRREEIGMLRQSELANGMLTIPGERTKNGRALVLPLPPLALEILQSVPPQEGQEFVFGRRGRPFSGWSAAKLKLDARIAITTGKPLAPWTFHDCRRTYRSGLGKLGVAPHVAELAINHVKGGVEAVYDRYRYQPEIQAALALWAAHVTAVVEGCDATVVPLRA
jgi:integrase